MCVVCSNSQSINIEPGDKAVAGDKAISRLMVKRALGQGYQQTDGPASLGTRLSADMMVRGQGYQQT